MTLPVFYVPREELVSDGRIIVDGAEGRHAAVVRRLQVGEGVTLTDGQGTIAEGSVTSVDRTSLTVEVQDRKELSRPAPTLVLVQALPKGERGELAVELMTEVGVDVIIPWSASRCIAHWQGERVERGLARWRTASRQAAKQSRRIWWPEVGPFASTADVVARIADAELALVLNEGAGTSLTSCVLPAAGEVVVIVGPEGGLTDEETQQFVAAGAESVRVGPTVLRTSTAGLVAAAVILSAGRRWSTT